jgi:Protein of unknown function (DUF4230)
MGMDSPLRSERVPASRRSFQSWLTTAFAFLAGLLVAALAFLMAVRTSQGWADTVSSWLQRTTRTDLTQPTVVDRIQKLQRLETIVYTMDKIVSGARESSILPSFLAGDRLLLMVHGEAIAGIDFEMLKPADVQVTGKTIRVHVPRAQLLVVRLDSSKTRVYSRQTGLLVATDPNLESQVRNDAEIELRRSAVSDGILQKAQENARSTLTSLMQSMGFEEVQFE